MRIAQIAPLTEAVPPKLYGGTERVVSWLTEELVALGHDVTLFASGDSCTSAKLEADLAARAAPRRLGPRSHCAAHVDARARPPARRRIRRPAFSSRLLSVLAVLAPVDAVRHDAARPARPARASAGVRHVHRSVPVVSISNAQRRPLPQARWLRTVYHGLPEQLLTPQRRQARLPRVPRPHRAGEGASTAQSASPSAAACRSRSPPRSTGSTATISSEQIKPLLACRGVEYIGEISDDAEVRIPERRARAADADRLARAVRPGDDRGDGLRHAGDRLQPRLGAGGHRGRRDRLHRRQTRRARRSDRQPAAACSRARRSARASRSASPRAAWRGEYLEIYRELIAAGRRPLRTVNGATKPAHRHQTGIDGGLYVGD